MENGLAQKKAECSFCFTRFSHRSSLVRHLRNNCNQSRQQPRRRKACVQCVLNKTRCNLNRPHCSRCHMRNTACTYASAAPLDSPATEISEANPGEINQLGHPVEENLMLLQQQQSEPSATFEVNIFDCLFSTPDVNESNLDSPEFIQTLSYPFADPEPYGDKVSLALATHSMELLFRVLRTWPKMLADEFQVPPLFHPTQITKDKQLPPALANCITLAKMWHGKRDGAEEIVRRTILSELESVVDQTPPQQLDEAELVSVLQAVVIYAIILISPTTNSDSPRGDHNKIFRKMEQLVWHVVRTGLFLQEEREQTRPTWEAWVHVTSKRRAVLALYLLHWAYSVLHRVPCFDCRDLGFMPAPAAKVLWQAQTEQEWNKSYIQWLARWDCQGYLQGELGKIRPGVVMNPRAERWFEETDEFGFLMISIVNATDYEAPALKLLTPWTVCFSWDNSCFPGR